MGESDREWEEMRKLTHQAQLPGVEGLTFLSCNWYDGFILPPTSAVLQYRTMLTYHDLLYLYSTAWGGILKVSFVHDNNMGICNHVSRSRGSEGKRLHCVLIRFGIRRSEKCSIWIVSTKIWLHVPMQIYANCVRGRCYTATCKPPALIRSARGLMSFSQQNMKWSLCRHRKSSEAGY